MTAEELIAAEEIMAKIPDGSWGFRWFCAERAGMDKETFNICYFKETENEELENGTEDAERFANWVSDAAEQELLRGEED